MCFYCVSPLSPCNYETTRVFYTLFVDFHACYGSHHLLAFLQSSAPFSSFYWVSCILIGESCLFFIFLPFKFCLWSSSSLLLHFLRLFLSFCCFTKLETVSPSHNYANDAYTMCVDGWTVFLQRLNHFHRWLWYLRVLRCSSFIHVWFSSYHAPIHWIFVWTSQKIFREQCAPVSLFSRAHTFCFLILLSDTVPVNFNCLLCLKDKTNKIFGTRITQNHWDMNL